jgi:predicted nucleic acid-binding protein
MEEGVIVPDASVALKWRLDDEEYVDQARAMLLDFSRGRIELVVPDLFFVEISNGMKVAVRMGRIDDGSAREFVEEVLELSMETIGVEELVLRATELAFVYDRSVYDCVYLAAAEKVSCRFFTADRRLYDALWEKVGYLKWIGEYSS